MTRFRFLQILRSIAGTSTLIITGNKRGQPSIIAGIFNHVFCYIRRNIVFLLALTLDRDGSYSI